MEEVFLFEFQSEQRIIYRSQLNDHIYELSTNLDEKPYPESTWGTSDVTKIAGVAAVSEFYFLCSSDCHTICFQSKDHQEIGIIQRGKNSNWTWRLTTLPFTPINSGSVTIFDTSENQFIIYRSSLDEIQELIYDKLTDQWSHRNLSRLLNLSKAFGDPKGIAATSWQLISYPLPQSLAILYRSAYFPTPEWRYQLVQQIPPIGGNLNMFTIGNSVQVVYCNINQKIILMEFELMHDFSLKMNLLAADTTCSDPIGKTGFDWTLIAYRKQIDNKLGILFKMINSQWKSIQLADPQPKITGNPYVYSNGREPVIIYRSDPDNILYLITRNTNGSFQVTNLTQVIEIPSVISENPMGYVGTQYHTIVYKSHVQKSFERDSITTSNLIVLTKKAGGKWKQFTFLLYREPLKWVKNAIVYQVYLRCFSKEGNFKSLIENIPRLKELGVNVIYLLPFHPVGAKNRKGLLGSPYAIQDYYAIDNHYGTLDDLIEVINTAHKQDMKVLYDFVPNHTSIDSKLLEQHKDWFLYNDKGKLVHPVSTWIDVGQLNHKNKEVWPYMLNVLKYWLNVGFDGFRCDYVDGVPHTLWKEARFMLDQSKPVLLLAEGWDPSYYLNCGFDCVYSWSTHKMISEMLIDKREKSSSLVRQLLEQEQIEGYGSGLQLRFTTTHDENAFNSRSVESLEDPRFVQLALLITFMLPNSIPTIFNGQEIGSRKRLSLFDPVYLDWQWDKDQLEWHNFMKQLIHTRQDNESLIDGNWKFAESSEENLIAFYRQKGNDKVLVILNLSETTAKFLIPIEQQLLKLMGTASVTDREIVLDGYQFYIGKVVLETSYENDLDPTQKKLRIEETNELLL